jgi:hypothetical protein
MTINFANILPIILFHREQHLHIQTTPLTPNNNLPMLGLAL